MNSTVCDECGAPATITIMGMTGRVLIDGVDNNRQAADFCNVHAPLSGSSQPNNCRRVRFVWPTETDKYIPLWDGVIFPVKT